MDQSGSRKAVILAVVTMALVHLNTVYHKLMVTVYSSYYWLALDMFMRCGSNELNHKKRSLIRNFFFNISRCLMGCVFEHLFFGTLFTPQNIALRIAYVLILTIYFQYCATKKTI